MRVLVVEDELKMASLLRRGLVEAGHAADVARSGDDALWMARAVPYDAVVLDLMLPGIDGVEVCRRLREADVWAPVLMLTARDGVEDRIARLDAGADDYLVKPFSFAELLARLRDGPGFAPGFLPRAFERFSRADEARGGGSAGLGLAIVEAVARAHGGRARAANHPGGGAEVVLELPSGSAVEDDGVERGGRAPDPGRVPDDLAHRGVRRGEGE